MKTFKPILAIIVALAFYSCSTVPLTGRSQLSLVSDDQINPAAAQSYRELLSDPKTVVISNTTDAQRVKNYRQ